MKVSKKLRRAADHKMPKRSTGVQKKMATAHTDVTMKEPRRQGELAKSDLLRVYRNMLTGRRIDEKHLVLLKQGKSFFHIGGWGHEAAQTAAGAGRQPGGGYLFPPYPRP